MEASNVPTASPPPPPAECSVATLASLLRPPTDLTVQVQFVVAEQQRLAAQIEDLNAKLAAATVSTPEDRAVLLKVDAYVTKLRAARRRVATLQSSLEGTKARLGRVLAHVKTQTSAVEKENQRTEQLLQGELGAAEALDQA